MASTPPWPLGRVAKFRRRARLEFRELGFLENPALSRELAMTLYRPGAFWRLLAVAALVAGAVYLSWPREAKLLVYREAVSRERVNILIVSLKLLLVLFGPGQAALSVTRDRDIGVLDLICSSPIGARRIFLAKVFAAVAYLWLVIGATMPIAATVFILGGVTPVEFCAAYAELFAAAAAISAYGVLCSVSVEHSAAALARAYSRVLVFGVIWLPIPFLVSSPTFAHIAGCIVASIAYLVFLGNPYIVQRLNYPAGLAHEDIGVGPRAGVFDKRDWRSAIFLPRRARQLMADWSNPVLTRELRYERLGGAKWFRDLLPWTLGVGMLSAALLVALRQQPNLWFVVLIGLTLLMAPTLAAPGFAREFDQSTFDALACTPLRPASILWPKLYIAVRTSSLVSGILALGAAPAFGYLYRFHPETLPSAAIGSAIAVTLATLLVASSISLLCSLLARTTPQALVWAYSATGLPFLAAPAGVWLLHKYSDLPLAAYAWLAALSPASPFLLLAEPKGAERFVAYFGGTAEMAAGDLAQAFIAGSLIVSAALFVVMSLGFDYFWKKGPLRRR